MTPHDKAIDAGATALVDNFHDNSARDAFKIGIQAYLTALEAEEYMVVPVEPDMNMAFAVNKNITLGEMEKLRRDYKAMLKAAPKVGSR